MGGCQKKKVIINQSAPGCVTWTMWSLFSRLLDVKKLNSEFRSTSVLKSKWMETVANLVSEIEAAPAT